MPRVSPEYQGTGPGSRLTPFETCLAALQCVLKWAFLLPAPFVIYALIAAQ